MSETASGLSTLLSHPDHLVETQICQTSHFNSNVLNLSNSLKISSLRFKFRKLMAKILCENMKFCKIEDIPLPYKRSNDNIAGNGKA